MDDEQMDTLIENIGNVNKVTGFFDPSPEEEDEDEAEE